MEGVYCEIGVILATGIVRHHYTEKEASGMHAQLEGHACMHTNTHTLLLAWP